LFKLLALFNLIAAMRISLSQTMASKVLETSFFQCAAEFFLAYETVDIFGQTKTG
jgi:hypothetical protein